MVNQLFECSEGHQTERLVKGGIERIKCPRCKRMAEIAWMAYGKSGSFLKEAVLVFKMADGSYSFPATNQTKTPKGAERLELRKASEVRQVMKQYNQREQALESNKEQRYLEHAERQNNERRAKLAHLMGQESDPTAKQLYRDALDRAHLEQAPKWREYYNESVE